MSKLRCGVAGLGHGNQFVSILESLPQCEVVSVCNSNTDVLSRYSRFSTHTDFHSFVREDLDIAVVITRAPGHAAESVEALERGMHVLCETPNVYSIEEAKRVVQAAKSSGKKYMLAENYIWMGWYLALSKMKEDGLLGEIIYAEGDYTHDCRDIMLKADGGYIPYDKRGEYPDAVKSWRAVNLPPLVYSSHTLGPLLSLMEDSVRTCTGFHAGGRTAPELGTIDLEVGLLQTEKGSVIRLTNGFTVAHPMSLHYKVIGTKGSALVQAMGDCVMYSYSDNDKTASGKWKSAQLPFEQRPDGRSSTEVMVEEFVQSVVDDTPPPVDIYSSLEMVLPGVLAHQSALKDGEKLAVPDFRSW